MLLATLLLLPVASADRGWFSRTFGPADADGDGIPDRDDHCPTFAEVENGYADDDGCPDYLSFVTVQATYNGRRLPFATYWMEHEGRSYVAAGPAMSLENLVPGATVRVAAEHACLGAEGVVQAGTDPVGIRLALQPIRDNTVRITVRDAEGHPVDAELIWTGSTPSACGPTDAKLHLPGGVGETMLGVGSHAWMVRADGRTEEGILDVEDPGSTLQLDVTLAPARPDAQRRLEPIVYFASGSARLDEAALEAVRELAAYLEANPRATLLLEGHTDTRASSLYNQELGLKRAEAVLEALVAQGIARERLEITSKGESMPASEGYSAHARALNRRVEAIVRNGTP